MTAHDDPPRLASLAGRPIQKVLVGASLDAGEEAALKAAVAVARTTGAALTVVHAIEPVDDWMGSILPPPEEELRERLARDVARLTAERPLACDIEVGAGAAHRVLDEVARRVAPDLIVVGATVGDGSALLGSTAERIVHKATVPVLVVRGALALPPRRVLAPVDLSPLSRDGFHCGLAMASQLAGGRSVHVVALFAIGYLDAAAHEMRRERWTEAEMTARAQSRLVSLVEEQRPDAAFEVESKVVLGPAREEILGEAARAAADLIVMSTHGHGGFERLVLGSVAAAVVREAPCSVILVPPTAAFGDAVAAAVLDQTAPGKRSET
jgi:nucleotide-binding universal stress UspA family protein